MKIKAFFPFLLLGLTIASSCSGCGSKEPAASPTSPENQAAAAANAAASAQAGSAKADALRKQEEAEAARRGTR